MATSAPHPCAGSASHVAGCFCRVGPCPALPRPALSCPSHFLVLLEGLMM